MTTVRLHLLGPFQALDQQGDRIVFRSNTERAMLAFLAVERARPHSRERLCALLWPEARPEQARNNLRVTLHRLKKALGETAGNPPLILSVEDDLSINPAATLWVDAWAFEQAMDSEDAHTHASRKTCERCTAALEEAVRLYRGDFLEGVTLEHNQAFAEWVLLQQEWYQRKAIVTLSTLAQIHLGKGELKRAERYAHRQLAMEPWREEAHRQLMVVYALQGERSGAISQFLACQRSLWVELGLTPSSETVALFEQICRGEFGTRALDQAALSSLPPPPVESGRSRWDWTFCARPWQAVAVGAALILLILSAFLRWIL